MVVVNIQDILLYVICRSPVYLDGGAGNEAGPIGAEKGRDTGYFLRCTVAFQDWRASPLRLKKINSLPLSPNSNLLYYKVFP